MSGPTTTWISHRSVKIRTVSNSQFGSEQKCRSVWEPDSAWPVIRACYEKLPHEYQVKPTINRSGLFHYRLRRSLKSTEIINDINWFSTHSLKSVSENQVSKDDKVGPHPGSSLTNHQSKFKILSCRQGTVHRVNKA